VTDDANRNIGRSSHGEQWDARGLLRFLGLWGWAVVVIGALLCLLPGAAEAAGQKTAAATENELCTREALAQMRAGGNAIDGAVTAALVAGVASPTSSGIGGGGFAVVWLANPGKPFVLDFREYAPKGVDVAAFEKRPFGDTERGKYSGVPGEVAGLYELHKRYGKRGWKEVVEPAMRLAKNGFAVGKHLANALVQSQKGLRVDSGLDRIFYAGGKPAAAGATVKNPELAATLERIATVGPDGFYKGEVAADLVAASKSAGGALTEEELAKYKPTERSPLHVKWEGYDIYTTPLPSAGGVLLAQTLALSSKAELEKLGYQSGAYQHVIAESFRGALSDRMRYIGDPAVEKVDTAKLLSPARMAARKKTIAKDRTHALPRFGLEEHGTHHISIADAAGNVVALTTTVNRTFGAKLTGTKSGVVLNDQLDDFTKQKDVAAFGLKQSPNRPRPGARPVSSMTPTIVVKNGQPVLAIGGSGGMTIATNVTQLLLGRLAFGKSPAELVKTPRFYVVPNGPTILVEKGASPKLMEDLRFRGEVVATMPFTGSAVQMIAIENGKKLPASDDRKFGSARAE
jgi:gamma-glutamyltranspeptidase / glutathione hydrolase